MEPEEFEDYLQETEREISDQMILEMEKRFTEGCIEGYRMIRDHGPKCIDRSELDSAMEALNRMMGYFIRIEHYEKCTVVKEVYQKVFKKDPEPIFPDFKISHVSLDHE